jgi:hypothetical protein
MRNVHQSLDHNAILYQKQFLDAFVPAALTLMTTTVSDPSTRHSLALTLLTTTAATRAPPTTPTTNLTTIKLLPGAYTLLDLTRVPLSLSLTTT